jgi:transcriptional regulator with XRE-family HTH domain
MKVQAVLTSLSLSLKLLSMTQSFAESIASEVRAELGRQSVTARDLAAALGLSQPQTSKRLAGKIEFRPSELEKAAAFLGVPVTKFTAVHADAA